MITDQIKIRLNKTDATYWKIFHTTKNTRNGYYTKSLQKEDFLFGKKEDTAITVYKKFGNLIGEGTVTITSPSEINRKIYDALHICTLSKNKFFEPIYEAKHYPKIKLYDKTFDEKKPSFYENKFDSFANKIKGAVKSEKSITINGFEVMTDDEEITLCTSHTNDLHERKSSVYAEAVLTAKGKTEQEYLPMIKETAFSQVDVEKFVKYYSSIAKDISNSQNCKQFTGNVVLTRDAVKEFFVPNLYDSPVLIHSSARMSYLKLSKLKIGKEIGQINGDKLTMINNPLLPLGLRSSEFDTDCVPAKKTALIENGIFKKHYASKRYADYLKVAPSGPLGNIEIGSGSASLNELMHGKFYEVVGFSSFSPNPYSGDFSAEIRLGYLHENGKRTPLKGGMLVGNVFDMVCNMQLSKEKIYSGGYLGPKAALFRNMTIA